MDIRKIALELSGKVAPDYKKYNRLEFMEYLEEIFWLSLDKIEFYRRQSKEYEEDFYFLVLDLLYNKSLKDDNEKIKFDNLIDKLDILESDSNILTLWEYSNEADFTQNFLVPFFKKLGYKDVKYTHGRKEYWKDIIMRRQDEFGNWRYIWVQAKIGNISWATASDIDTLIGQAKDWFAMSMPNIDEKDKITLSEFIIVTNEEYTENAIDKIIESIKEPSQKNNITFLDKTKINNLLD